MTLFNEIKKYLGYVCEYLTFRIFPDMKGKLEEDIERLIIKLLVRAGFLYTEGESKAHVTVADLRKAEEETPFFGESGSSMREKLFVFNSQLVNRTSVVSLVIMLLYSLDAIVGRKSKEGLKYVYVLDPESLVTKRIDETDLNAADIGMWPLLDNSMDRYKADDVAVLRVKREDIFGCSIVSLTVNYYSRPNH